MREADQLIRHCYKIVNDINSNNLETYRGDILDTINAFDKVKVRRDFNCKAIETNLLIKTNQGQEFTIADFLKSTYNITPNFKDAKDFGYGNKTIYYPQKYINNFGFRLGIFHEGSHDKNKEQEEEIKRTIEYKSAGTYNDKRARTDGYKIAKRMDTIYKVNTIQEFKSIEDICAYANIHLLVNVNTDSNIEQFKQNLLEPKHFLPKM